MNKIPIIHQKNFHMRKLFFILSLPLIFSFVTTDIELTKKEREDAVSYFKETQKAVADEIKGMSDNQLKWKPADSVWSITDCVEHIALSEKNLFDWAMGTLKTEANPAKRAELKRSDEEIKKESLIVHSGSKQEKDLFLPVNLVMQNKH